MSYSNSSITIENERFQITFDTKTNVIISIIDITTIDNQKIIYPQKIGITIAVENTGIPTCKDWDLIVNFISTYRLEFKPCGTHIDQVNYYNDR